MSQLDCLETLCPVLENNFRKQEKVLTKFSPYIIVVLDSMNSCFMLDWIQNKLLINILNGSKTHTYLYRSKEKKNIPTFMNISLIDTPTNAISFLYTNVSHIISIFCSEL